MPSRRRSTRVNAVASGAFTVPVFPGHAIAARVNANAPSVLMQFVNLSATAGPSIKPTTTCPASIEATEMACKDCKFMSVPLNAAGRRVVYKERAYRCQAPEPAWPPIPACMENPKTFRNWIWADAGEGCPTFEQRAK